MHDSKCVSLVDVDIADGAVSVPQESAAEDFSVAEKFSSPYRFIDPGVAAKCHTGSLQYQNAILKLQTNKLFRDEIVSSGILFLELVPDVFVAKLRVFIPGMN